MIEINLLPEQMRKKEPVKLALPEIPIKKTLFAAIGIVVALQVLLVVAALGLRMRAGWLEGRIAELQRSGAAISAQKTETTLLQDRLKQLRAATGRKFYWAKLLDALTASTTRGVWLRTLSVKTEEVSTAGASNVASPPREEKGESKKPAKAVPAKLLALEGSAIGTGQETAFIGKFLQSLKDNETFKEIFSDIQVSDIQQRRIEEVDAYDFLIICKFKKDKA